MAMAARHVTLALRVTTPNPQSKGNLNLIDINMNIFLKNIKNKKREKQKLNKE
jgi:small nuclear ribonucleoprotein (snRNP)-like protein